MVRIDGYYWVSIAGSFDGPRVMEWIESDGGQGCWYSCGIEEPWRDEEIYVLSGRLESPTKAT